MTVYVPRTKALEQFRCIGVVKDQQPPARAARQHRVHGRYRIGAPGCIPDALYTAAASDEERYFKSALAASGLAHEPIDELGGNTREQAYNALALLFVMAKTGEVEPLVQAIEKHPSSEVRRASVRLLSLTGQEEIAEAAVKRRLFANSKPQADGAAT